MSAEQAEIKKAFDSFDTNGDGIIMRDELYAVMKKLGCGMSDEELDAMFNVVDRNGDGKLDIQEFLGWLFDGSAGASKVTELLAQWHNKPALQRHGWQEDYEVPSRYRRRRTRVGETHYRAMTIEQLNELGELIQDVLETVNIQDVPGKFCVGRITWAKANLYHINDLFVMQLTAEFRCSFMEVVAKGRQKPVWFISHWWGTVFSQTLRMLNFHIATRDIDPGTPYWMCTFANNQHDLGELDQPDLLATPFVQAIMSEDCIGTLMVLNRYATPFTRIWCVLEDYVTLSADYGQNTEKKASKQLLDVATMILEEDEQEYEGRSLGEGPILLVDDGNGNLVDTPEVENAYLPSEVSRLGGQVDVRNANASNPSDKVQILRLIGDKASEVNETLQRKFAPRALCAAAQEDRVEDVSLLLGLLPNGPDEPDTYGVTALFYASDHGNLEVTKLLLAAGAGPNATNDSGRSPVWVAANRGEVDVLRLLLRAGGDPSMDSESGTPLGNAGADVRDDDPDWIRGQTCCKLLLQAGAEPSGRDYDTNGTLIRRALDMDDFEGDESPTGPLDFKVNIEAVKQRKALEEGGGGVRCPAGHILKKQRGKANYCDDCRETGTAYRCGKCDFDLCQRCYSERGGSSPPNEEPREADAEAVQVAPGGPRCPEGHLLKNDRRKKHNCDECNRRGTAWRCDECDFDLCQSCYKEREPEPEGGGGGGPCCPDGHPLRKKRMRNNHCNECERTGTDHRCDECDYDVCKRCFKEL